MSSLSRLLLISAALAGPLAMQSAAAGEPGPAQAVNLSSLSNGEGPAWLGSMAGEKLVAVDGSTLTLSPSEGGLALALVAPNGAAQKSSLAFVSDRLGTISDDIDAGHVTGFFRETDNGLEAQFADGRTESLVANTAGGISITIRSSAGDPNCTSWYPADHVFSASERKAALDAYAARLGLGQKGKKAVHAVPVCVPGIRVVKNKISPHNVQSMIVVSHPDTPRPRLGTDISVKSPTNVPALIPVVVRASDVHLVDGPTPVKFVAPITSSASSAPQPPAAALPAQSVNATTANASPTPQAAVASQVPTGSGASDCLTVDSDGANLGFRNHCGFGVQFAYCLQRASDAATACDEGSKTGAVSANGFAAVLLDTNIKTADADHDFRWVACSGNTGDVIAHIDRSDPPSGRCVRTSAL
ncbi:MAG TPA: hypothetical protein VMF58_14210 [Rhizomicrobium sp.]|nr:hypothetical protein [Rhizomicrobium sp.]